MQKAQRVAAIGMLLRQYGHSRVVASTGVSVLRRFISALTGRTTKEEDDRRDNQERNERVDEVPEEEAAVVNREAEGGEVRLAANGGDQGVIRSLTKAATTAPNAAPMMIPTARSTTLPRRMKALKSFAAFNRASPFVQYERHHSDYTRESNSGKYGEREGPLSPCARERD